MSLRLRNTWDYKGKDWWKWEAFLDDDGSGELSQVQSVEYVLHETFPNPIQRIDSPVGGFRLKTSGWGTFDLIAFVYYKDGKKVRLKREIQLEYIPEKGTSS
jgi:transcription initiation factor IIF auxiliary subunit